MKAILEFIVLCAWCLGLGVFLLAWEPHHPHTTGYATAQGAWSYHRELP